MMFKKNTINHFLVIISLVFVQSKIMNQKDPFDALGIPDINPKQMLEEIDREDKPKEIEKKEVQLRTIDDLPNFLQKSNLSEDEGIEILTRFLIQDDLTLKKYGVVYDQTGFDGIARDEARAPLGTEERLVQRARSAANIHFKEKYPKLLYDAYGAEGQYDEIIPNWRIYKVLMIGSKGENTFLKVCLPLDESETALVSDKDEPCSPKAKYVEKEKQKNEDYIKKIKSNNFFKKANKNNNGMIKLLPGEQLKFKGDNNQKVSMSSQDLQKRFQTMQQPIANANNKEMPQQQFAQGSQIPSTYGNYQGPNTAMNNLIYSNLQNTNINGYPQSNSLNGQNLNMYMNNNNRINPNFNNNYMNNNYANNFVNNNNPNNTNNLSFNFKQQQDSLHRDNNQQPQFGNYQNYQNPQMNTQQLYNQPNQFIQNTNNIPVLNSINNPGANNVKFDQNQFLAMSNQINFLTQQLALKQKQLEDVMKPKILEQGDKFFMRKPNLK